MARFVVRRTLIAIALLIATSIVVWGIFELIPSYKFGFDKPVYVQYANTMKLIFTGQVIDYQDDLNVVDQFRSRFGATLSLVIPAGILWLVAAILFGSISALRVGRLADRALMVAAI